MKKTKLDQVNNFSLPEHLLISKCGTKYMSKKQQSYVDSLHIYIIIHKIYFNKARFSMLLFVGNFFVLLIVKVNQHRGFRKRVVFKKTL